MILGKIICKQTVGHSNIKMSSVWNVIVFKQESTLIIYPKNIMLKCYGNQNNKKSVFTVGLISKTTTSFALRHTFLYISLPLLLQENNVKLPTYTFLSLIKNNEKFQQVNATAIRVCCKWIHPWYVLTTKFTCAHTQKICCLWSCSLFFCTTAHCHLAGRYNISHFLITAKKSVHVVFFQRNQSPLHFPLALATILDKINGKPKPPLPPKSRMGKWRVFALRAASSLIWGGRGMGVCCSILFCPRL